MLHGKIIRHKLFDRLFHWLFAITIFILLGTGLLPRFGINFNWLVIHWVTGVILIVMILIHSCRSIFWKNFKVMIFKRNDFSSAKPGKYSLAQKLMHHFISLITLLGVVTGVLMLVRIDSPFWERNPYLLEAETWGWIYVFHGVSALVFVSTIMLHIYFSVRPEKNMYLRSMFKGWISSDEYHHEHDANLWPVDTEKPLD